MAEFVLQGDLFLLALLCLNAQYYVHYHLLDQASQRGYEIFLRDTQSSISLFTWSTCSRIEHRVKPVIPGVPWQPPILRDLLKFKILKLFFQWICWPSKWSLDFLKKLRWACFVLPVIKLCGLHNHTRFILFMYLSSAFMLRPSLSNCGTFLM